MDGDTDDPSIETRVGDLLRERDGSVAVAEGATGGLVTARLTGPPGASSYLDRGYVTYGYDSLREELAVCRETLDEHGAVSAPVAREMARGARDRSRTDWGLAVVGIAGPDGGTPDRPIGTTYVGVASAAPWDSGASWCRADRTVIDGESREAIRQRMARQALEALHAALTDVDG